jgi:hypothetical protein
LIFVNFAKLEILGGLYQVMFLTRQSIAAFHTGRGVSAGQQFCFFGNRLDVIPIRVLDVFGVGEIIAEGEGDDAHEAAGRCASRILDGGV